MQRRTNRRWAAGFLVQLWDRYDGPPPDEQRAVRHSAAIGLVGGMFDLISDWLLDADLTNQKPDRGPDRRPDHLLHHRPPRPRDLGADAALTNVEQRPGPTLTGHPGAA